jgi:TDG/mug DNA glycosylase family protein
MTIDRGRVPGPVVGFPAAASPDARVLILGAAPSVRSLEAGEYYAHPRNAFWRIMEALFAQSAEPDYAARTSVLLQAKVALWDVLRSAERRGSLDASIVAKTVVVNDFAGIFEQHPGIRAVFFNGRAARALWDRHVAAMLPVATQLSCVTLPSTSPANAKLTLADKVEAWRVVVDAVGDNRLHAR